MWSYADLALKYVFLPTLFSVFKRMTPGMESRNAWQLSLRLRLRLTEVELLLKGTLGSPGGKRREMERSKLFKINSYIQIVFGTDAVERCAGRSVRLHSDCNCTRFSQYSNPVKKYYGFWYYTIIIFITTFTHSSNLELGNCSSFCDMLRIYKITPDGFFFLLCPLTM